MKQRIRINTTRRVATGIEMYNARYLDVLEVSFFSAEVVAEFSSAVVNEYKSLLKDTAK